MKFGKNNMTKIKRKETERIILKNIMATLLYKKPLKRSRERSRFLFIAFFESARSNGKIEHAFSKEAIFYFLPCPADHRRRGGNKERENITVSSS